MVDNKYCQLHPEFYSCYFQFSSSSIQGRLSQDVPLNCKSNKEACEYLHVISNAGSNVWTALQKDLLDLIFKTLVQLMLLFTKYKL